MKNSPDNQPKQGGFTIVEMSIALAIFAVLSLVFATQLVNNYGVYGKAKERTTAEQIASSAIERARELDYADVGIIAGNPVGLLPASETKVINGQTFVITNSVEAVSDPAPDAFSMPTSYKRLRVTVTSGGVVLSDLATVISSPKSATAVAAVMRVMIADFSTNLPLPGATVTVQGGPSPLRTDLTDVKGRVSFSGLLPTTAAAPAYDITASLAGYTMYPGDLPPSPAAQTSFGPNQVFDTTLRMFQPVTVRFDFINPDGSPFTLGDVNFYVECESGNGYLTASSTISVTETVSWDGVTAPIVPNQLCQILNAQTVVGGREYYGDWQQHEVPDDYPSNRTSVFTVIMHDRTPVPSVTADPAVPTTGPVPTNPPDSSVGTSTTSTSSTSSTTTSSTISDSGM